MNRPRHWPRDPAPISAPVPTGAHHAEDTDHEPYPHEPPTHGRNLCHRHGTRPPLALRRRRARLPYASRLKGPRRPDRHSPHHRPCLAAFRVVDCRNEGIAPFAPAPSRSALGLVVKNPGAAVAAPGFNAQSQNAPSPPLGRRRRGRAQARRRTAPTTFRTRPAAMGGTCGATPRFAAAGCPKACRPRRWRLVACTSRRTVHRHAARPCNGASTPRLMQKAACNVRGACALVAGCCPCPCQGAGR